MKKTVCWLVSLFLVFILALTGCGATLTEAANLEQYEMSGDVIPSITSVVGEREVTGVEAATSNGVATRQYTYSSATVYDDLLAYVNKLLEDGWLVTQAIDLNIVPGSGELGMKSVDDGQILLVSLSYEDSKYVIKLTKGKGTIE
jgi:hypothetical protein